MIPILVIQLNKSHSAFSQPSSLQTVGSKGAGGLAEQLMGSTSTQLSERSTIPVVVVPSPHPGRQPEAWPGGDVRP